MKTLFTSFGIDQMPGINSFRRLPRELFYRMPPVDMRRFGSVFMPDYAVLLLCDRIVMDRTSYEILTEEPIEPYRYVAQTVEALAAEGFVELADFQSLLTKNTSLMDAMMANDLRTPEAWTDSLTESVAIWQHFAREASTLQTQRYVSNHGDLHGGNFLVTDAEERLRLERFHWFGNQVNPWETERKSRKSSSPKTASKRPQTGKHNEVPPKSVETGSLLRHHLSYVNANIVLSRELGVSFYDWADFLPFYRQKFLGIGRDDLGIPDRADTVRNLFEVSFPEFEITDTETLLRVLHDKRVVALRELVEEAVNTKVVFDQAFARSVFREVLHVEKRSDRYRNIVSYLTMPLDFLGFLPGVGAAVQKGVEEVIGSVIDRKVKDKYQWFYLLSDIVEPTHEDG